MTNGDEPTNAITSDHDGAPATIEFEGLTKREYFAAAALGGMMSPNPTMGLETNILATCAVQFADALIEALNK